MRIGVDATRRENRRGYGRFTREWLPALAALARGDTFLCFVNREAAPRFDLERANRGVPGRLEAIREAARDSRPVLPTA